MSELPRARPVPVSSTWRAVALAAILAVGLWPHLYVLQLSPVSRDDVVWITKSATTAPNWVEWVFRSEHFVGFRPMTALSYTLDSAIGGTAMLPYRATDLLLHLGAALLVYAVYRRLVPNLPAWGGLAASAFLLLHPVTGLVVPHLARRAYPLATVCSLFGIWLLLGRPRWVRGIAAAVLLGAGALANEAAYVAFPVAILLLFLREDRRSAIEAAIPSVVVCALLVLQRFYVLGGAGGYAVERGGRWLPIVGATWNGLLGLDVLRSGVTPLPDAVGWVVVPLVVGALAIGTLLRPKTEAGTASIVLWAWVVGLIVIYAPQGVFFPRQLYVPLAPFALVFGIALAEGVRSTGARQAALLGGSAVLALLALRQSPVVWGSDPVQYACWRAHDRLVRDMVADLRELPPRSTVNAVVPYYRRPEMEALRAHDDQESRFLGRQGLTWVGELTDLRFGPATLIYVDARSDVPMGRLEPGPTVILAPGMEVATAGGDATVEDTPAGTVIHPDISGKDGRVPVLYFHDGQHGVLTEIR